MIDPVGKDKLEPIRGKPTGPRQEGQTRVDEPSLPSDSADNKAKPPGWKELSAQEKSEKAFDNSFNFFIAPLCAISLLSSMGSLIYANFLDGENEFLDKVSELSNKGAYFFNGIYGAINNALSNNIVGAVGYSCVSLASIVGNNDNMYQWKAPGSALDQLPGLNDCTVNNKKIMKKYPGTNAVNAYKNFSDSIYKTWDSIKAVISDIYDEYKSKLSEGKNIFKTTSEVFVTNERNAERHLVISSIGIFAGFFAGIGFGFKKLGSTIRDIFGILADIGIFGISKSPSDKQQSRSSRVKYGFSGSGYLGGGLADLIYRWAGIPKADLLAVGLDNLGFGFMTWANADSNKKARELARQKNAEEIPAQMAAYTQRPK
ncbi:MAG: hypothetical protein A3I68_08060 [Candidatus Melainabacteria bacterium RIFCSPLOWO2_02_FULL_35_15]|nr:MAG: hypothetical protein A3F80_02470 [Candidatus Melainabacteria bacterium RIFCSPLOWO2_12_FULL_35_11]OGI14241.1 MAG: hypothetical protein A3I68_08060 [Candidatus Melainabacteria bacterium RIFCSPLOWO2_02_FULL_35_15]